MRIAIVGAGALGAFYGAKLALAGFDVHFLLRRDYQVVRRRGLHIHGWQGDFHLAHVNCYLDVAEIGLVDLVFIGLKTTANDHYEQLLQPLMGNDTLALTAQNGLGNEEQLAEMFGPQRVAGGLAFLCSNRRENGVIEHLDYGQIHIGNYDRPPDATLRKFGAMLNACGVQCQVVDDLALARWKKLVWNVPFSGLSALLDMKVNQIVADGPLRLRARRLMDEVQAAAAANAVLIEDCFLHEMIAATERMKPYYTSMHLDARTHRPLEVDSIIGQPLRRGIAHGLDMPEMAKLYAQLLQLDQNNRSESQQR